MNFSPSDLKELLAFAGYVALAIFGGGVAFVKALDLTENPPVKIRFYAELMRRLLVACFVGVLGYAFTKAYGPQPPLVWVVAGLSGVFAAEALDFIWVMVKEQAGGFIQRVFKITPKDPP